LHLAQEGAGHPAYLAAAAAGAAVLDAAFILGPASLAGSAGYVFFYFNVLGNAPGNLLVGEFQLDAQVAAARTATPALARAGTFEGVAGRLRSVVAKAVSPAWQLATTADFAYPWTADKLDLRTKVALKYLYRVLAVSPTSRAASQALLDVNQMVATPNAVFRPAVVAAVLRGPRPGPTGPPPLPGEQATPPVAPPALNPVQEAS